MRIRNALVLALGAWALAGCGGDIADRAITGAALGAGGVAIAGGSPLVGAVGGGAIGALTPPSVVDFGPPPWRR